MGTEPETPQTYARNLRSTSPWLWQRSKKSSSMYPAEIRERRNFIDHVALMRYAAYVSVAPVFHANRFPWQSRHIVVENLMDIARETRKPIRVFKCARTVEFYGDGFFSAIDTAAQSGCDIEVIFAQPIESEEAARWKMIRRTCPNNLLLFYVSQYDKTLFHYCLVGDEAYRLEFPHPLYTGAVTDNKPERPARFSFNDQEVGRSILVYHDLLKQTAERL